MCMAYPPTIHLPLWVLSEMDWSCLDLDWQRAFPESWLTYAPNDRCANTYKPGDKQKSLLHVQKTGRQTARLRVFFFPGLSDRDGWTLLWQMGRCASWGSRLKVMHWHSRTLQQAPAKSNVNKNSNRWILLDSCNYSSTEQQCFQSAAQRFETNMGTTVAISQHAVTVSVTKIFPLHQI